MLSLCDSVSLKTNVIHEVYSTIFGCNSVEDNDDKLLQCRSRCVTDSEVFCILKTGAYLQNGRKWFAAYFGRVVLE